MTMFIHFFCLCPLSLTIKLNFNISKVAYWYTVNYHTCHLYFLGKQTNLKAQVCTEKIQMT